MARKRFEGNSDEVMETLDTQDPEERVTKPMEVTFIGKGMVWDKEKDKPLCRFVGGRYTTSDQRVVNLLNLLGYPSQGGR